MAQIIKLNFSRTESCQRKIYKSKLIRIRDEIEDYLILSSINEDDELAVALAAGRFAAMKLTQITGKSETQSFINECINTSIENTNKHFN